MKTENMNFRSGEEADRKKAAADAFADESLIAAESEFACEDALFAGDLVFPEEYKLEISRKMDLSAVKMSGEDIVAGKIRCIQL